MVAEARKRYIEIDISKLVDYPGNRYELAKVAIELAEKLNEYPEAAGLIADRKDKLGFIALSMLLDADVEIVDVQEEDESPNK